MLAGEQKINPKAQQFLELVKNNKTTEALAMINSGERMSMLLSAKDLGLKNFRNSGWTALHWAFYHDNHKLIEAIMSKLSKDDLLLALETRTSEPWRLFFGKETIFGYEYRKYLGFFNGLQTPLHFIKSDKTIEIFEKFMQGKVKRERLHGLCEIKDALDQTPPIQLTTAEQKTGATGGMLAHAIINHQRSTEVKEMKKDEFTQAKNDLDQILKELRQGKLLKTGKLALRSTLKDILKSTPDNVTKEFFLKAVDVLTEKAEEKLNTEEAVVRTEKLLQQMIALRQNFASLDHQEILKLFQQLPSLPKPRM